MGTIYLINLTYATYTPLINLIRKLYGMNGVRFLVYLFTRGCILVPST